jgi:Arc/MetJ-type ribon-helix-helix transcriptional regulator
MAVHTPAVFQTEHGEEPGGPVETEKVCINLPAAELGKIVVLVAEGLFASRTDLIRSGIRSILDAHDDAVRRVARTDARIGYQLLMRSELEAARNTRQRLTLFVVGVLRIQGSVTPDLADAAIERIRIFGTVRGPAEVLARIEDRIIRGGENLER